MRTEQIQVHTFWENIHGSGRWWRWMQCDFINFRINTGFIIDATAEERMQLFIDKTIQQVVVKKNLTFLLSCLSVCFTGTSEWICKIKMRKTLGLSVFSPWLKRTMNRLLQRVTVKHPLWSSCLKLVCYWSTFGLQQLFHILPPDSVFFWDKWSPVNTEV